MAVKTTEYKRTRQDFFYFSTVLYNAKLFETEFNKWFDKKGTLKRITDWSKKIQERDDLDENTLIAGMKKIGFEQLQLLIYRSNVYTHIVTVFSALCLEALINDYCIIKKSISYFDQFDKITPVAKWILFPKLITGQEIENGGQVHNFLIDLYKVRNSMVHSKSKEFKADEFTLYNKRFFTKQVQQCLATIRLATQELYKIDPSYTYLKEYMDYWNRGNKPYKITSIENFYHTIWGVHSKEEDVNEGKISD